MLNIFGALGQVARLLPNYVEGQRQAVQDNWRDLQQYNQVQAGQLTNMATERTLPWYFNMYADMANNSRMGAYLNTMAGIENMIGFPGRVRMAQQGNVFGPQLQQANFLDTLQNLNRSSNAPSLPADLLTQAVLQGLQPQQQQPMQNQQAGPIAADVTQRVTTPQPTAATMPPQ